MKPQEAQLVNEISKLQCMVTELKIGFSGALLELSQIQHGDTHLRGELEETRKSCRKKALRLEALVESLREELGVIQCQVLHLGSSRSRPQQEEQACASREKSKPAEPQSQCDCSAGPAASPSRGKLLLHCFLQGLKAGLNEGTDARHQVAMQLLHSEWEYVSTLNQLYDRHKTPPAQQLAGEPYQAHGTFVEQLLQRHLLFRNTLQERLSAEHWKSLVGDILVQLIGHNDTAFSDMYVGYTTTLASFLSVEVQRRGPPAAAARSQAEREEMKTLSLLLTPVSRIHSYLSHIQNLLQWTSKDHPDCTLLLGSERALRALLARCHVILEEDVRWEEGQSSNCEAAGGESAPSSCQRSRPNAREEEAPAQREQSETRPLTNGVPSSLRVECWSCSPVRRRSCGGDPLLPNQCAHECGHACCSLLTPGWGETSDSGQGTFTGKGTQELEAPRGHHDDCETDADDTSAFDYSSVTSCSPDGTLCRGESCIREEGEEGGEEEEDSQVPVLLKPLYGQQQGREAGGERAVALRWQIPRMTPHPPLRSARQSVEPPTPCLVSSYRNRLVSVRKGSPPLHPKSAFRPIWDDPNKQVDMAPEKDSRQGFLPIQTPARSIFQNSTRENLRPGPNHGGGAGGLWEDSEDSEGPCSTV